MTRDPVAEAVLRSVAAMGLDGASDWPSRPLTDGEWRGVLQGAVRQRILGLLASAVETGQLPVSPAQSDEVATAHMAALHSCLRLEAHLISTAELLAASDVDLRVLKGPAVAHLDYEDPSQRTFVDIDLLVRPDHFDLAVEELTAAGHRRRYRELRPGFDRRFGKGACLVSPGRWETDLHRTFVMGPYGLWVDLDDLWTGAERFRVGGRDFLALAADQRFLHACYHAALGDRSPRLSQLRDVAQMLLGPGEVDVDRVRAFAKAWHGEAVLARAISLAWESLGLPEHLMAGWAREQRTTRTDARAMAAYLDPAVGFAARSIMAVRAVPRWRDKAAFIRGVAMPSRSYGAGRHGTRGRRWGAALRDLRQLVRGRA